MKYVILAAILCLSQISCNNQKATNPTQSEDSISISKVDILTADDQAQLTPQAVYERLVQGNKDFTEDNLTIRNNTQRVREASLGQFPKAVVLSCLDSRVPVEDVFHSGIGDLFVARVAGNIVNDDILGSLEFACKVSGSKVIVVLGHEYCGAVKSAIDQVKLGNITTLLNKVQPAVQQASKSFEGEKKSSNPDFVKAVGDKNVHTGIEEIRKRSPILKEMEDKGEILILGGVYDMHTGKVEFLDKK